MSAVMVYVSHAYNNMDSQGTHQSDLAADGDVLAVPNISVVTAAVCVCLCDLCKASPCVHTLTKCVHT